MGDNLCFLGDEDVQCGLVSVRIFQGGWAMYSCHFLKEAYVWSWLFVFLLWMVSTISTRWALAHTASQTRALDPQPPEKGCWGSQLCLLLPASLSLRQDATKMHAACFTLEIQRSRSHFHLSCSRVKCPSRCFFHCVFSSQQNYPP